MGTPRAFQQGSYSSVPGEIQARRWRGVLTIPSTTLPAQVYLEPRKAHSAVILAGKGSGCHRVMDDAPPGGRDGQHSVTANGDVLLRVFLNLSPLPSPHRAEQRGPPQTFDCPQTPPRGSTHAVRFNGFQHSLMSGGA